MVVENAGDKVRPTTFFGILWENKVVLLLLVFCIGYFFYLSYVSREVPNTTYITERDPFTNVTQTKTVVLYPLDAQKVPAKPVTNGHAFVGALAVFILAYYILMKLIKDRELIPFRILWEKIVRREVEYMAKANYPEFAHPDKVSLVSHRMQHVQIGDGGERKPFVSILCFHLEKDSKDLFYVVKCHPYTGFIFDIMEEERAMIRKDSCANCGSSYYKDIYVKLPSDVGNLYRTMRGSSQERRP